MVPCRTLGVLGSLYAFMLLGTTSPFTQALTHRGTRGDGLYGSPLCKRTLHKSNSNNIPILLSTWVLAILQGHLHISFLILATKAHDTK